MNAKTTCGERVKSLRASKGLSQQAFADQMNVSRSYLASVETGRQEPSFSLILSLITTFSVEPNWLFGVGGATPETANSASDFIPIPKYTVSVSAGNGSFVADPVEVSYYALSLQWIKRRQLDPKMLHIVQVRGDSMEPSLRNNDLILVDRAQDVPNDGKTYVVRIGDELVVKHIQRLGRDAISLVSGNSVYPPREVTLPGNPDEFEIIGRVVASMHEW